MLACANMRPDERRQLPRDLPWPDFEAAGGKSGAKVDVIAAVVADVVVFFALKAAQEAALRRPQSPSAPALLGRDRRIAACTA